MTALKMAWLLAAMVGSIGPGLLVVRRFRWSPLERLCGAIVVSQALLYLVDGLIYVSGAARWTYAAAAVGCLACCAVARREIAAYRMNREARQTAFRFGLLACWTLLLLAMIRHYSGAFWAFDWMEHYERSRFFLEHLPLDTRFTGVYALPARPPLMNMLVAHFLGASSDRFEFFQVASLFLNILMFIPASLLLRLFGQRAGRRSAGLVLLFLFVASPMFIENATYAWTKSLATCHVLAGFWFYLAGIRRRDPIRLAIGLAAFAVAVLVHYSAAPFALFACIHLLLRLVRRDRIPLARVAAAAMPAAVLLASWVGWSIAHYGFRVTFGSNTTVEGSEPTISAYAAKVGLNLFYSILPHPLRVSPARFRVDFFQPSTWGYVRDYAFTVFQTNLVFALGIGGGIAAIILVGRELRRPFWLVFVVGLAVLTIATNPAVDLYGVAHVCSQPLIFMGVAFLAARYAGLPRWARLALVAGAALDFIFGVLLQVGVEHWQLAMITLRPGAEVPQLTTNMPSLTAVQAAISKYVLHDNFLGDHFAAMFALLALLAVVGFVALAGLVMHRSGDLAGWRGRGQQGARGEGPWAGTTAFLGVLAAGLLSFGVALTVNAGAAPTLLSDPSDAQLERGLSLARAGRANEGMAEIGDAFALDPRPGNPRYFSLMFATIYSVQLPPTAGTAEAVVRNPQSAGAQNDLGTALASRGEFNAAAQRYALAHQLDPRSGLVSGNLGRTYLQLGRNEEGVAAMRDAVREEPSNPEYHYALAVGLYRLDHRDEMIAELREALRLKPDYTEAANALKAFAK